MLIKQVTGIGPKVTVVGVVCALTVLLTGCGDSDTHSAGFDPAPSISKAEFIKRATAICKTRRAKLTARAPEALRQGFRAHKSRAEIELDLIGNVMAPYRKETIDRVRALGAPPGDAEQVGVILDSVDEVLDEAEDDPRAFRGRQRNFKYPFKKAFALADAYGIPACAEA